MQALLSPLRELADYDSLKEAVRKGKGPRGLDGVCGFPEKRRGISTAAAANFIPYSMSGSMEAFS